MSRKLLDEEGLRAKGIKVSKPQRNRLIRQGKFPRPCYPTPRRPAWLEEEIDDYIESKIAERPAANVG